MIKQVGGIRAEKLEAKVWAADQPSAKQRNISTQYPRGAGKSMAQSRAASLCTRGSELRGASDAT